MFNSPSLPGWLKSTSIPTCPNMKSSFLPANLLLICLPYTYLPISHQSLHFIHSWIFCDSCYFLSPLSLLYSGSYKTCLAAISDFIFIFLSSLHIAVWGISLKPQIWPSLLTNPYSDSPIAFEIHVRPLRSAWRFLSFISACLSRGVNMLLIFVFAAVFTNWPFRKTTVIYFTTQVFIY